MSLRYAAITSSWLAPGCTGLLASHFSKRTPTLPSARAMSSCAVWVASGTLPSPSA